MCCPQLRQIVGLGVIALMLMGSASAASTPADTSAPRTVSEWLQREHAFLHRYLKIVQQATHDYSYDYKTPALLMPVTIDLFTGYVAPLHDAEERFLYPVLRKHMTPEQQRGLQLIETDEQEETGTVKSWQQQLEQYEAGQKQLTEVAETIDYLARMINRHIVLQEQRVVPFLDSLTSEEQAVTLKQLRAYEQARFGANGRFRYEQLLSAIEGEIKAIAGRIW